MPKRRPCRKCGKNRAERFYVSARGKTCATCRGRRVQYSGRAQHLMDTYGITLAEYEAMAWAGCNICGGKRVGNLDVDHSHSVEKALLEEGVSPLQAVRRSVRGTLCRRCNRRLLPGSTERIFVLQNAINYLMDWPADKVLSRD